MLQPLVMQHLSALTPRAVQTLSALLSNKSGYIRLEAAKDILNRNGVGLGSEPIRAQPLIVRINLAVAVPAADTAQVIDHETIASHGLEDRPGGRKLERPSEARTPAHDFSPQVQGSQVSAVLELEAGEEGPLINTRGTVEELDL